MKKAGRIISNVLVTVVLIFSIITTIIAISSTKSEIGKETGLPNFFGKALFAVESDSMDGDKEDSFKKHSLIIVDLVDHTEDEGKVYKVGDIVTFVMDKDGKKALNTHRIVADPYAPENEVVDGIWINGGEPCYLTKGDKLTANIDSFSLEFGEEPMYQYNSSIVAVRTNSIEIPLLGGLMLLLKKPEGFAVCVVIPTLIFFLFELFKFISILMENKKQKAVEAVKGAEEEIKQKVIAEMLAKQEAEKSAAASAASAAAESDEEAKRKALEEEIKQKAIAEYLAQQEAEKKAAEESKDSE